MILKPNMYVRTKEGIRKITDIWENMYELNRDLHNRYPEGHCLFEEDIEEVVLKASNNIIDLIEVGDYVNGHQVYEVDRVCCRITLNGGDIGSEAFRLTYLRPALGKNMGIKSIVTKEQFKAMEYVVGDSDE